MADEFVKVPFKLEADGTKTFFLPDCRLKKGYEIGARDKDKERGIQNYWEALEKVSEKIGSLTVFGGIDGLMKQLISLKAPGCQ